MTLNTAPLDMDGNVVLGDPGYWIRYQLWQTRPCVDFTSLLQENRGMGAAWNYWLEQNMDALKRSEQWEALGLGSDGRALSYASTPLDSMTFVDLGTVDWKYQGDQVGYEHSKQPSPLITITVLMLFGIIITVIVVVGMRSKHVKDIRNMNGQ